ncbi:MAG: hypothetical protein ACJ78Q_08990 [Chloroflexia bacterium]
MALAGAVLVGLVAVPLVAYEPEAAAAGWQYSYWPVKHAARVRTEGAKEGSYVLMLRAPGEGAQVSEMLLRPAAHPAIELDVSAWARATRAGGERAAGEAKAELKVMDGERRAAGREAALPSSGEWVPLTATVHLVESANQVTLYISSLAGNVEFDDVRVEAKGRGGSWDDPVYGLHPLNGSAEVGTVGLRPWLARLLPTEVAQIADALANPQPFDKATLWRTYADGEYRSFWGYFGYLSVPLPEALLVVLGIVSVVALGGLVWAAVRRVGRWSWREWAGVISFGALLAAVLIGFARQMALFTFWGIAAYPQGRYLFVMAIPVAWLLISGLWLAWASVFRTREGSTGVQERAGFGAGNWGAWLWVNALLLFAGYCLLGLVGPYYYGL